MNTGKITSKQAMIIFLILVFPLLLWYVPKSVALISKQAGWLAIIPGIIFLYFFIIQINYILMKNPRLSLMECFEKSTNKIFAKFYGIVLLVMLFLNFSTYLRYVNEQITSSIFPYVQNDVFIISVLVIVNFISKSNITMLARMGEMLILFLLGTIIFIIVLLVPNISIVNITPISYLDIIPTIKTGIITFVASFSPFYIYVLLLSDNIVEKKNLMSYAKKMLIIFWVLGILILIGAIGVFGYYLLQSTTYSYITLIKHVKIFNFFTGFESIFIIVWVISEYIALSLFMFCTCNLIQYLFNIKHIQNFINVVTLLIYILTKVITKSAYTLGFLTSAGIYIFILGYIIPILMVFIYRIRFKNKE